MTDVKRLLAEATPLPWDIKTANGQPVLLRSLAPLDPKRGSWVGDLTRKPDGRLIVHATNNLPAFLDLWEEAATVVNGDEAFNADGSSRMPALKAAVERLREAVEG